MHRFFVPPEVLSRPGVQIRGDVARQIALVLRLRAGEEVCLLDGQGSEYRVVIRSVGRDEVLAETVETLRPETESTRPVTLYLALLNKPDKFEWALQKCTELGAAGFVPMVAAHSVAAAPGGVRLDRWRRILREAAEQSGRTVIPSIEQVVPFVEAIQREAARASEAPDGRLAWIPAVGAPVSLSGSLGASPPNPRSASLFIGPEGGFTEDEVRLAEHSGVIPVSLGKRVLRSETAAVAALVLVMEMFGEM